MEVIFISKERVRNPLIDDIREIGRIIKERGLVEGSFGNISVRYGNRIIITSSGSDLGNLGDDDFVEVADYNPITNIALAIGTKKPSIETPMHWLIYGKPNINAVIHTHKIFTGIPTTENYAPAGSLDLAKEVLKALRKSDVINILNHGSVAVGINLRDAFSKLVGRENPNGSNKRE
ncbi:MAG TPA: class II aldolase/adducin family protein [Thermoplasmatales archaeon]|nr:class II aldolase/adducin family protein [Thermoplasmatales archaeon]